MQVTSIASYDIWDTVLRRRCHPDAVKVHVAHLLLLQLGDKVKPHLRDAWALFYFRQEAERALGAETRARGFDDEYLIKDVLERWVVNVTIDGYHPPEALIQSLLRAEIEQEKAIIYKDPTIEDQFRSDGAQRRIFVSDFYMGKEHLLELLSHVGVAEYFDDGYVSCDASLNKRSGRLFHHVFARERMGAQAFAHWGDNQHSDVHVPHGLGVKATVYLPSSEHSARGEKERRFNERSAILQKLGASASPLGDVGECAASTASLFLGYMLFVQEQIVRQRLQHVFFFTREGEFFLQIYEALRAGSPHRSKLPEGRLLEVSRLATFGPSLEDLNASELMRLWNLYSIQSPGALLATLDFSREDFGRFFERYQLPLDEPVKYPWQDARVLALLEDVEFKQAATSLLSHRRALFVKYCSERGLDASIDRCAVVDIGWRGTIQDNIAYMLPATHFVGFYLGLGKLLNAQPQNTEKHAFGPDLNQFDGKADRELLEFVAPIEMLTNSPSGSTRGYETSGRQIVVQKVQNPGEEAVYQSFTHAYQEQIIEIARKQAHYLGTDSVSSAELRPHAISIWRDIIQKPNRTMAQAYFSLVHNETFGLGKFVEKSDGLGPFWWIKLALLPSYRTTFRQKLSALGWTAGYTTVKKDKILLFVLKTFYSK